MTCAILLIISSIGVCVLSSFTFVMLALGSERVNGFRNGLYVLVGNLAWFSFASFFYTANFAFDNAPDTVVPIGFRVVFWVIKFIGLSMLITDLRKTKREKRDAAR